MLPDPLHPAVVHLPIALAVLMPLIAGAAWLSIRAGWMPGRLWVAVVAFQVLLVGSAWLALETGEDQEERVEDVVKERFIEAHEEAAERFLWAGVATAVVSGVGLLGGSLGAGARIGTIALTAVVLGTAIQTGHEGGELVYEHGAASAYVHATGTAPRAHDDDD